jgi:hypothetical protein
MLVALVAGSLLPAAADASYKDRFYQFGDDVTEHPSGNGTVAPISDFGNTSVDTIPNIAPGIDGFHDVTYNTVVGASVAPKYVRTDSTTTNRPGAAATEWGLTFDGVDEALFIDGTAPAANQLTGGLGIPSSSDFDPKYENLINWTNISTRHMEGWVRPTGAAAPGRQTVVSDTEQFQIFVSAPVSGVRYWGMQHGDTVANDPDVVVTSEEAVEFDEWTHVMQRSFQGDAVLYVNGLGVAHTTNNTDTSTEAANPANLVFGAGQNKTSEFFAGQLDNWNFYVSGDNATQTGPPAGMDWGAVDLATENDFIRQTLEAAGNKLGDVNLDNSVDEDDVAVFIANWLSEKEINGFEFGDLETRMRGDFDFDGEVDLDDALVLRNGLLAAGSGAVFDLSGLGSVPEPGSLVLLATGLAAVFGWRRRRG